MRCTQATLEALGVYGHCPIHGSGVTQALTTNGIKYQIAQYWYDHGHNEPTLKNFLDTDPKGKYIIATANHSMALIDGVLTDTAKGTNRRKIKYVLEVFC